uniref:Uncharacterized protein n=1 Tax=Arundo donax TaxID=35708 RepID=A0A0A9BAA3_ARUDO
MEHSYHRMHRSDSGE